MRGSRIKGRSRKAKDPDTAGDSEGDPDQDTLEDPDKCTAGNLYMGDTDSVGYPDTAEAVRSTF